MNTKNNKRFRDMETLIETSFLELLRSSEDGKITVKAVCTQANVNRNTFYAHYVDILDLQEKMERKMTLRLAEIFSEKSSLQNAFTEMFTLIQENKQFYMVYLSSHTTLPKLHDIIRRSGSKKHEERHYHISFVSGGSSEIIRIWMNTECKETPMEMSEIIFEEYSGFGAK